jgi:hypothetical protein
MRIGVRPAPPVEKGELDMTSASLLIVLLVGAAVGALVGLLLGGSMDPFYLAILAGFAATIIAGTVRNLVLARAAGLGPDDSRAPVLVIVYSAVASLAGSALALEIAQRSELNAAVWLGTLAGLFSCILGAMLMITYFTHPGEAPKLRR